MMMRTTIVLALLAGCPALPTSAGLGEPEILAIVADPPCVAPGGSATLAVLVAGPSGTLVPDRVSWSVPDGDAASISMTSAGAPVVDAGATATRGTSVEIDVDVAIGSTELRGFRTLAIGDGCANPTIDAVDVGGTVQPPATTIDVPAGSDVALDVDVTGGIASTGIVSWYSTAGAIDLYRQTPTTLAVTSQPGAAVLYVVYRDGLGGVTWRAYAVEVD